ncbi:hypothetical protein LUZ60_016682 [Juncus effusus]|nr:hypothetical protein LUZ60_016682 [Juncus effusus]
MAESNVKLKNPRKSDENEEDVSAMAPWEQHAAVINLPRYDYKAPPSFLQRSRSGFLVTCPIKREKSATKEGISFLEKYIKKACCSLESSESAKKRKLSPEISEPLSKENISDEESGNSISPSIDSNENIIQKLNISLVKLTRSGLILLSFQDNEFHDKVAPILSDLFLSLKSKELKSPRWCNRIFPIQETCVLSENELNSVVSKLFKEYFTNIKNNLDGQPIKFAVGYNRRGSEETKENKAEINKSGLMEREQCFKIVGKAITFIAQNSIVDLKSPQVVVLVELLPILGLPDGSSVVGVSVLPFELVSTKPKLSVKSLLADSK